MDAILQGRMAQSRAVTLAFLLAGVCALVSCDTPTAPKPLVCPDTTYVPWIGDTRAMVLTGCHR